MNLKSITIERAAEWRDNAGQLCGEVTFDNPVSKITLKLTPDMVHAIFDVCADALAAQAAEAAGVLRGNILDTASSKVLESPRAAEEGGING